MAEGFDPGWITSPEEPEGENTFDGFITAINNSRSLQLQNLISDNPSQYDLVYVNWRNGTDFLQRNALVLEEVIREVNRLKQPLDGIMQPNVVLGSSMGGVIARMALGRMDRGGGQNGAGGFAALQTSLYVSLDAPHQGANVPLGYQAAARHATRMYVSTGPIAATVEIIQLLSNGPSPLLNLLLADQPASRQMLTNRIDINYNQTNATNQQFLQELRTQWAYPNPNNIAGNVRNIAISNGSECAIDQEFAAGSSLLYHFRSTKTRFIGDLIFMVAGVGLQALNVSPLITIPLILPGSSKFELTIDIKSIANGGGNAVYYGNIKLTKKILWLVPVSVNIANKTYNAPTGILPFDTYPGGFYTLFLANQPGSVSQDWMFSYNNSFFIQRRFSFIPTTSALDIGQGNTVLTNANYLARYVGATPPIAPLNTPFANFATAFNQDGSQWNFDNNNFRRLNNEPHEGLYLRNANFLADELNGVNNVRTNCEAFCANGTITGNTIICTSQTLTVPFGNGVTYNWSVNSSIVTITPNGNTVLITRVGTNNGQAIISVIIGGACGNTTLTIPIIVGTPVPVGINGPDHDLCYNGRSSEIGWFYVVNPINLLTYYWQIDGQGAGIGSSVSVDAFRWGVGNHEIRARSYSATCGYSEWYTSSFIVIDCSSNMFTISPNPSSENIYVRVNNSAKNNSKQIEIREIELIDKMGNIRHKRKFDNGLTSTSISVGNLPNDIYTMRIFDGEVWHSHKISIQH